MSTSRANAPVFVDIAGQILAMATAPDIPPDDFRAVLSAALLLEGLLDSDVYEAARAVLTPVILAADRAEWRDTFFRPSSRSAQRLAVGAWLGSITGPGRERAAAVHAQLHDIWYARVSP